MHFDNVYQFISIPLKQHGKKKEIIEKIVFKGAHAIIILRTSNNYLK